MAVVVGAGCWPGAPAARGAPAKPGGSGDVEVARWALGANAGPTFVTFTHGGQTTQVTEAAKLPAGKFDLVSLSFTSLDGVTPGHLRDVGRLGRLGFLEFKDGSALTAEGVAALAEHGSFSTLIISKTSLPDAALAPLAKVKSLRTLSLRECPALTGAVWQSWAGLGLTEFALGGWRVSREHLPRLAGLRGLQKLTFAGSNGLSAEDFGGWSHPGVWQVWLVGLDPFDGRLRSILGAFPKATQVYIHNTPLGVEECRTLAQFRPLQYLQLSGCNFGDSQIPALAATRSIATFDCYGFTSSGSSLDQLAPCRQLRALAFIDGRLTDDGLAKLAALSQVEHLTLNGNPALTDAGIAALARLKQLRTLRLGRTPITDAALARLVELRKLESLEVTGCPNITAAGVGTLLKALPKCKVAFDP
jgi:hypothetical protein